VFLDLDPALFEVVLNWLRQFALSRGGNMHQPQVPQEKFEHMVVSAWQGCSDVILHNQRYIAVCLHYGMGSAAIYRCHRRSWSTWW
jgi:hypothetical protein